MDFRNKIRWIQEYRDGSCGAYDALCLASRFSEFPLNFLLMAHMCPWPCWRNKVWGPDAEKRNLWIMTVALNLIPHLDLPLCMFSSGKCYTAISGTKWKFRCLQGRWVPQVYLILFKCLQNTLPRRNSIWKCWVLCKCERRKGRLGDTI